MMHEREYLGDGVYCHFDGFHVWLTTMRENGEHRIALEPSVLDNLVDYFRKCFEPQDKPEPDPPADERGTTFRRW